MTAFGYICRSFRQTTPFIIGALKLLADTYSPNELNQRGYALYCDFRPDVEQWGKRSELFCSKILSLRKQGTTPPSPSSNSSPTIQHTENPEVHSTSDDNREKPSRMTLEEYEAALDEDHTFDDVALDFLAKSGA